MKHSPHRFTLISFTVFIVWAAFSSIDEKSASCDVQGKYTAWLKEMVSSKSYQMLVPKSAPSSESNPVIVNCLETPEQRYYIGVSQTMIVNSPLEQVSKVIEDVDHYADLFPSFANVKIVSREGDRMTTAWEQEIPIFFIPNVKYRMIYTLSRPDPNTHVYQYQLDQPGTVRESDGFVVLEKMTDQATRYIELDFFNANWGALETFAPSRIWKDSIDAAYAQDLAIKLKAETPTLSSKAARDAADRLMKSLEKAQKKVQDRSRDKSPGEICADHKTLNWAERFPGIRSPFEPVFRPATSLLTSPSSANPSSDSKAQPSAEHKK